MTHAFLPQIFLHLAKQPAIIDWHASRLLLLQQTSCSMRLQHNMINRSKASAPWLSLPGFMRVQIGRNLISYTAAPSSM
jgi:hypothetical protein